MCETERECYDCNHCDAGECRNPERIMPRGD